MHLSAALFRNIKNPLGNTSLHISIWLTAIKTHMSCSNTSNADECKHNNALDSHCWHREINRQCSGKGQPLTCDLAVSDGLSHLIVALKQGVDWHSEAERGPYVSEPSVCHRLLSDMQGQTLLATVKVGENNIVRVLWGLLMQMNGGRQIYKLQKQGGQKEAINENVPVLTVHGGFWDHGVLEVP